MKPLYERLRPQTLADIAGQEHLTGERGYLAHIIRSQKPISLLLYGPPGSGKTTLARLYAKAFNLPFYSFSGVNQTVAELKKLLQDGEKQPLFRQQMILFVDEIHRLNRAQQDIFLPHLENGSLILVGATTNNPSFVLNQALLSRLRVLPVNPLTEEALDAIVQRYETIEGALPVTPAARQQLLHLAQGDGRHLMNLLETIQQLPAQTYDVADLSAILQRRLPSYDQQGEGHYNLISALHKAVRGSDPNAALYWLTRMLHGGEEPLFIARRIIRMATEDVGLADPQALPLAVAAYQTYQILGSPEGELALAELVVYLALAPKTNSIYTAYGEFRELAEKTGHLIPPKTILNAPTHLMKEMGYGEGYIYDHDTPNGCSGQNYWPDTMDPAHLYKPIERGFERELKKRLEYFEKFRQAKLSDET